MNHDLQHTTHEEPYLLRRQAESAARWIGGMRVFSQLLLVLISVVLARLLQPEDYGLYAMVLVLVQFSFYIEGFRLEDAVVQRREMDERLLSAAHYLVLIVSVGFTVLFWMAIPAVMWFFAEPALFWPLAAVSTIFLMRGSAAMHRALLRRRLEIRTLALIQFGRIIPGGLVGIGAASLGYGVWSLVAYVLVKELTEAISFRAAVKWRPSERYSWTAARRLIGFGGAASANEVVTYIQYHLPTYVIGRWLGASVLGLFKFGFVLVGIIPTFMQYVLQQALFPALSRAQDDSDLVRRAYLRGLFGVAAITFFGAVLLNALSRDLILTFVGDHWADMIPVVQVLAFLMPAMAFQSLFTASFQAIGYPERDLVLNAILAALVGVGIFVGIRWGVEGVAWAYVSVFPVYVAAALHRLNRQLSVGWRPIAAALGGCVVAAFSAWIVLFLAADLRFVAAAHPFARIAILGLAGTIIYGGALVLLAPKQTIGLIRMVMPGCLRGNG